MLRIRAAALVHDIGKINVPRAVLNEPGRLSDAEFSIMERPAADGASMVARLGDTELTRIVRHHHERIDGRGYPDGLAGRAAARCGGRRKAGGDGGIGRGGTSTGGGTTTSPAQSAPAAPQAPAPPRCRRRCSRGPPTCPRSCATPGRCSTPSSTAYRVAVPEAPSLPEVPKLPVLF